MDACTLKLRGTEVHLRYADDLSKIYIYIYISPYVYLLWLERVDSRAVRGRAGNMFNSSASLCSDMQEHKLHFSNAIPAIKG